MMAMMRACFWIALCTIPVAGVAGEARISVGPHVQVTDAGEGVFVREVVVCADPGDVNRLLALSHLHGRDGDRPAVVVAAYTSLDAGKSWRRTADTSAINRTAGDPTCAYGPDGTLYFGSLIGAASGHNELFVYRSADGGRTWQAPVVAPGSVSTDRPFLVVDRTGGPYHGRIYATATMVRQRGINGDAQPNAAAMFRSMNGGVTFEPAVRRSLSNPDRSLSYYLHSGAPVVLSDGTVVAIHAEIRLLRDPTGATIDVDSVLNSRNAAIRVYRSTDGGHTLTDTVSVSQFYHRSDRVDSAIPTLAADPGSATFGDRLYAAWVDTRVGRSRIMFAYSGDRGATWSAPRVVSDTPAFERPHRGPDAQLPALAVNRSGVVGLLWYDRRDNTQGSSWQIRFAASLDGGDTFLPSVAIADSPRAGGRDALAGYAVRVRPPANSGRSSSVQVRAFANLPGHTSGLAADAAGRFHALWVSETEARFQAWTAVVSVDGSAAPWVSTLRGGLSDMSDLFELHVARIEYDREQQRLSALIRLRNTSDRRIAGPVILRLIALESPLGPLRVANADNGLPGPGAVWNLSFDAGPGGAPQVLTKELVLTVDATRGESIVRFGDHVLTLDTQIFGTTAPPKTGR